MSGNNLNVPLLSLGSSKLWGFAVWEVFVFLTARRVWLPHPTSPLTTPLFQAPCRTGMLRLGGEQVPVLVLVVAALAAHISSSESLFPTATRGKGGGKKGNPQHWVLQCRTGRGKTALDISYRDTRLSQHHLVMPRRYQRKQEKTETKLFLVVPICLLQRVLLFGVHAPGTGTHHPLLQSHIFPF